MVTGRGRRGGQADLRLSLHHRGRHPGPALLHAHGFAVALNSARTLAEMQEYSRDYGCVGAVAEYGSVVWNAVAGRTQVLVTPESRGELQRSGEALRRIPGVFLNDRYEHSLRAYAFEGGRTVPLPTALMHGVSALGLTRLRVTRPTSTRASRPRGRQGKGPPGPAAPAGVRATWRRSPSATRSRTWPCSRWPRAPARPPHLPGAGARLLGCRIAPRPYQPGLLNAVRSILHPGGRCPLATARPPPPRALGGPAEGGRSEPLASLLGRCSTRCP